MKRVVIILSCLLMSSGGFASMIPIALVLESIQPYKVSERGGDELYMDFLIYPSKAKASHFTIPKKPLHWPSFIIPKLNNIVLWKGVVKKTQTVTIHGALLEKDAPPWNRDDLIGGFVLLLSNKAGKLSYALREDKEDKKVFHPIKRPLPTIMMKGSGAQYKLRLKLVDPKSLPRKKKKEDLRSEK